MEEEKEEWRDIVGFEGFYKISNLGRVKSMSRTIYTGRNLSTVRTQNETILAGGKYRGGYFHVGLYLNGSQFIRKVHRLVCSAFIDNIYDKPQVDHIDGDKTNNKVSNLRWVTGAENIQNPITMKIMKNNGSYLRGRFGKDSPFSKSIVQKNFLGDTVRVWDSMSEIKSELGYSMASISMCCNSKRNSAYGFAWSFKINHNNP